MEDRVDSIWNKDERQEIVDKYLASTGRNMFKVDEFTDWLEDKPDHPCYERFFGSGDKEAARQHRMSLARQLISGLRIQVHVPPVKKVDVSSLAEAISYEAPAFLSPMSSRRKGGGYVPYDPESKESRVELRKQAAADLARWLNRYRGCTEACGLDLTPIETIVTALREEEETEAA
jgi:hypothetical protein